MRGGDTDAPKSKYARRVVPLPPAMARHLWTARQGAADSALVFLHDGKPVQRTAPFRAVRLAAKRAGIGWPVGLHSLRHSYASILFSRGASAVQVQRVLGHHSPAFTLAVYVHLLPDDAVDTAYLDALLPLEGVTNGSPAPTETGRDAVLSVAPESRTIAANP